MFKYYSSKIFKKPLRTQSFKELISDCMWEPHSNLMGKELLLPRLWASRREIKPRGRRRRRKELTVTFVWCHKGVVSPRQGGCTLLWWLSSITHGLEMVLPPNATFKCHKASVERGKRKSKRNLLLLCTVLLQNLVTMEKFSLQTWCPVHALMIFIAVKNLGCGCPDTALLCSSERGRNSWLLLFKAKYQ